MDCYRITFESVDLPEGFARNTVVQMNKGLACIHPYFHWNTITITTNTILSLEHLYFHWITITATTIIIIAMQCIVTHSYFYFYFYSVTL